MSATLLSTMFEFVELRPREKFDFEFDERTPVKVEKPMTFKQVVKKMAKDDPEYYRSFYSLDKCLDFFTEMLKFGDAYWTATGAIMTQADFTELYDKYTGTVGSLTEDAIAKSWFVLYKTLEAQQHSIVLNSFGVDTQTVVRSTLPERRAELLQLAVNFDVWEPRDVTKFKESFL